MTELAGCSISRKSLAGVLVCAGISLKVIWLRASALLCSLVHQNFTEYSYADNSNDHTPEEM